MLWIHEYESVHYCISRTRTEQIFVLRSLELLSAPYALNVEKKLHYLLKEPLDV